MDIHTQSESPGQGAVLYRGQEIIGLPVIDIENGNTLGQVNDILYHRDGSVTGFLISDGQGREGVISLSAAVGVGSGAVTAKTPIILAGPAPGTEIGASSIAGTKVITAGGDELGSVRDVTVDWETGRVVGLELSDGLIRDVIDGRAILPLNGVVTWGEGVLIVENRFTGIWNGEEVTGNVEGGQGDGLSGV